MRLSPEELYPNLFEAVQMGGIFSDSKTFVDCVPKQPISLILKEFEAQKMEKDFDLKTFVLRYFALPEAKSTGFESKIEAGISAHIERLWEVLTREADSQSQGTLIPLPYPYIVPGGRFGEIYYWDSYFTMLGLEVSGRQGLIEQMVANFAHLIDAVGHIPNGNRTYFLSRSQPPFFSLMVALLHKINAGKSIPFLQQLEKEYRFWMDGESELSAECSAIRRVVLWGNGLVLNRYWDDSPTPRPESFREDVETAHASEIPNGPLYTHIRAACESGWDFSSRWNVHADLNYIETTDILPVDLNCLLWHLEDVLAKGHALDGDAELADFYENQAEKRKKAIQTLFFQEETGCFMDFNFRKKQHTGVISAAMAFPLFFNLHTEIQGKTTCENIETHLLKEGGLLTTNLHTGQQWDAPNGWAPLQWIGYVAAKNGGSGALAENIRHRWMKLNERVFERTGKMMEKYNVEDLSLDAGGGEYPVQDGFGWSNGVYAKFANGETA